MSVVQTLSAAINVWLERKKSRSLSMLARMSDVGYSTVRRCAQAEGDPSQEVALAIASVVMSDAQMREFIGAHWPGLKKYVLEANHAKPDSNSDDDVIEFIRSEPHFKVIVMASHQDGVDEQDVVQKFGADFIPYFDDLKNAGHLRATGIGKWIFDKDYGNVSRDLGRECLRRVISMNPRTNDEIPFASSAYVSWESVTREAAVKISDLASIFCTDLYKIVGDKANRGDILVACGVFHSVLKGQEELK